MAIYDFDMPAVAARSRDLFRLRDDGHRALFRRRTYYIDPGGSRGNLDLSATRIGSSRYICNACRARLISLRTDGANRRNPSFI